MAPVAVIAEVADQNGQVRKRQGRKHCCCWRYVIGLSSWSSLQAYSPVFLLCESVVVILLPFSSELVIHPIIGAPVLERTLDRKTKRCEGCGFKNWARGDKLFIVQSSTAGMMEWLCPDCAVERGLPHEHYHRNQNCNRLPPPSPSEEGIVSLDFLAGLCQFWATSRGAGGTSTFTGEWTNESIRESYIAHEKNQLCSQCLL